MEWRGVPTIHELFNGIIGISYFCVIIILLSCAVSHLEKRQNNKKGQNFFVEWISFIAVKPLIRSLSQKKKNHSINVKENPILPSFVKLLMQHIRMDYRFVTKKEN